MRILLISSFTTGDVTRTDIAPPLSLLYLAAALREGGHEPVLLDLTPLRPAQDVAREEWYRGVIMQKVAEVKPDLVGQNCFLSTHFAFVRSIARAVKALSPSLPFVVGGIHPTLFAADIITNCPEIDYIVTGEGEGQAVQLADALSAGTIADIAKISALAYRDVHGRAVVNPRASYETELDRLPMPAWDLVNVPQYFTDHSTWYNPRKLDIRMSVPILTSRSCPYDCNFCSAHRMMGRGLRLHSPTRVVDEMERLYRDHGVNYFGFVDDNLTLNKKHVMAICAEIVKRGLVIQFESFNGYNIASMDDEIVDAMCAAGCIYVIMPIEHGSDYMRNQIIGKKLPRDKIFRLAEIYKKHNLLTRGVFIMGFPEETVETLEETHRMMEELDLDLYNVFTLIPFPGTKVFDQAVRDKLLVTDVDPSQLWEGTLQLTPLGDQVFLKPYNLDVAQLLEYRAKFDAMRIHSDRARRLQKGNA
jgi:radical SAM superfamily enzyme YgiQ (UPF0313 family)